MDDEPLDERAPRRPVSRRLMTEACGLLLQFLQFGADRRERSVLVLFGTEIVRVRSVRSVDRLLQQDGIVLGQIGLLRPLGTVDKSRDVVSLFIAEDGS